MATNQTIAMTMTEYMLMPISQRLIHVVTVLVALVFVNGAQATPKIEHWQTANGARVYFVPAPDLPMLDIRMVFDAGSARNAGKGGLAQLTSGLLSEGAGELSADQIAERFESVGAVFGASAQRDMAVVSLRSLTDAKLLTPALETLKLVVSQPSFPAQAFDRERNRVLIALRAQKESPDDIADQAFFTALYGDHPYAADPLGTEDSVKALAQKDVVAFHKQYYVARNVVIALVGAVDRAQAERIANLVSEGLPAGSAAAGLPAVPALTEAKSIRINYPSAQTHILIGQPGISRGDPEEYALYVGNHILGGNGLVSRLSEEVREKRGLSYSTYSYFIPMRAPGPYILGTQTRNNQAEEGLQVMMDTLRNYLKEGPSEDELKKSKLNITGGFALRLDSNSKIVEYIAMMGFYGLPLDYLDNYINNINAVSRAQIKQAMGRLDPQRMITVMVGGTAQEAAPAP